MVVNKTYIIAEVGLEAMGQIKLAEQLIDAAKVAGADCIKFQLYSVDTAHKVDNGDGPLTKYRLDRPALQGLWNYSKGVGIDFLLSAFDMDSLKSCKDMGLTAVKIPSVCNENVEMTRWACSNFKTVLISLGMLDQDVIAAKIPVNIVRQALLCTSVYPCPFDQVNLAAVHKYAGLSDHTIGWEVSVAAVAMGAKIMEKHLTLSRMSGGPDACCALEPMEFADMVYRIRNVEKAMGDGVKKIEEGERSLLWRKNI